MLLRTGLRFFYGSPLLHYVCPISRKLIMTKSPSWNVKTQNNEFISKRIFRLWSAEGNNNFTTEQKTRTEHSKGENMRHENHKLTNRAKSSFRLLNNILLATSSSYLIVIQSSWQSLWLLLLVTFSTKQIWMLTKLSKVQGGGEQIKILFFIFGNVCFYS